MLKARAYLQREQQISVWKTIQRIRVFAEALDDLRALRLCESIYGREFTLGLLEEELDRPLKFSDWPKSAGYILKTREKIDLAVARGLSDAE